jgi:hypothetical protein
LSFEVRIAYGQILLRQGQKKGHRGIHPLAGSLDIGSAQCARYGNPAAICPRLLATRRRLISILGDENQLRQTRERGNVPQRRMKIRFLDVHHAAAYSRRYDRCVSGTLWRRDCPFSSCMVANGIKCTASVTVIELNSRLDFPRTRGGFQCQFSLPDLLEPYAQLGRSGCAQNMSHGCSFVRVPRRIDRSFINTKNTGTRINT